MNKKPEIKADHCLVLKGKTINYTYRVSLRARHIRLSIKNDGRVVVTQPAHLSRYCGEDFLRLKVDWVLGKLANLTQRPQPLNPIQSRTNYLKQKNAVRELILKRLEYFNNFYNFSYRQLNVRNQKTRWGSCSRKGNLNFNYRIGELAPELVDYIVVHELCHLQELNHSPRFWSLVAKTTPNYKKLRQAIRGLLI